MDEEKELKEPCECGNCDNKETKKEAKNKYKLIIEEQEKLIKELKDKMVRIQADAENRVKRNKAEADDDKKYALSNILTDLIDPLDQLNKVVNMQTDNELLKNFLIGFKMINNKVFDVLSANGVKKIVTLDKIFDPKYHNAIETINDSELKDNLIIEEFISGYMYKDRVLRPASVKVNIIKEENKGEN